MIRTMLCRWRVAKRPGLDNFLKEMAQLYEIVVFTDSLGGLADEVCELPRERVLAFLMGGERRSLLRRYAHARRGGCRRGEGLCVPREGYVVILYLGAIFAQIGCDMF